MCGLFNCALSVRVLTFNIDEMVACKINHRLLFKGSVIFQM